MTMAYVGDKISQIDGIRPFAGINETYDQLDCVAAVTAALIDIATLGRVRVTASDVRRASGIKDRRGLRMSEAADAAVKLAGVILEVKYLQGDGTQRGRLRNRLVAGHACGVLYDAGVTYGTPDATNQFRDNHFGTFRTVAWHTGGDNKPLAEAYGDDPGTTSAGWRWWDFNRLCRAAEAPSAGNGGIWILVARDTEAVPMRGRAKGNLRAKPTSSSSDIGNVHIGRSYRTVQTLRGGAWKRPGGSKAHCWVEVVKKSGRHAFVKGESLA